MKLKPRPPPPYSRTVRRFAWVPVDLSDGQRIWLEAYWTDERREGSYDGPYWARLKVYQ